MNEHPKAFIALQLAKKPVLIVNSDNLHAMREGLLAMQMALETLIKEHEATEARHAAELRELKERFSEALLTYFPKDMQKMAWFKSAFGPFILPKPDPLFEAMKEVEPMTPWEPQDANELRAAIEKRGGKIVWGDDQ